MDKNMPTVLSTSTEITILFTGWTTSTVTEYIFTLAFIFLLAILNRFLGALKSQFELFWSQETVLHQHQSNRKAKLGPVSNYLRLPEDYDPEEQYLSVSNDHETSTSVDLVEGVTSRNRISQKYFPSWKARETWSPRRDGTRASLEGARAVTGYLLMIVVMTCNIGVFATVSLGVLVGELILGRFSQ